MPAPDEELLGKLEGYPVCRLDDANIGPDRCLVGLFSHIDEAIRHARSLAKVRFISLRDRLPSQ